MTLISKGKAVPSVSVNKKGELISENGSLKYIPWSIQSLVGKVRVINHFAGRSSAKELNEPLITALKAADLPHDSYQTTTIINLKDAMWGTSALVVAKAEAGKKAFPWSSVVIDEIGEVRNTFELKKESSAIIVLDAESKVLFFKDGALSQEEVGMVMNIIAEELEGACA